MSLKWRAPPPRDRHFPPLKRAGHVVVDARDDLGAERRLTLSRARLRETGTPFQDARRLTVGSVLAWDWQLCVVPILAPRAGARRLRVLPPTYHARAADFTHGNAHESAPREKTDAPCSSYSRSAGPTST